MLLWFANINSKMSECVLVSVSLRQVIGPEPKYKKRTNSTPTFSKFKKHYNLDREIRP